MTDQTGHPAIDVVVVVVVSGEEKQIPFIDEKNLLYNFYNLTCCSCGPRHNLQGKDAEADQGQPHLLAHKQT